MDTSPVTGEIDDYFQLLSDPVRRQVIETLGKGARRAGDLAEVAGATPSVMSRHLRLLLAAGMVDDERSVTDARVRLFFLRRAPLELICSWLGGVLSEGESQTLVPGA